MSDHVFDPSTLVVDGDGFSEEELLQLYTGCNEGKSCKNLDE